MKATFNVYTIDNHPNQDAVYSWIRDNWHSTGSLTTGSAVEEFRELIENSKGSNKLFYENGSPYMYDGVLSEEPAEEPSKEIEETWEEVRTLVSQTSYGINGVNKNPTISITVGIKECGTKGYFEYYDVADPDRWHSEGGLWFRGNKLVDYDGVGCLSSFVEDKLKEWGYEIDL